MSKQPRIAIEDLIQPFPIKKRPSLAESHPHIAVFWNYKKNKGWGPEDFSYGSNVKAWWHCAQHKEHVFRQVIQSRVKSEEYESKFHGCTFYSGRKAASTNWLANYPDLAKEWLEEKNGQSVFEVVAGSNDQAWWKCQKCRGEYQMMVLQRSHAGVGCPFCAGKKVSKKGSLADRYPFLIRVQWHKKLNGPLTPEDVPYNSKRKYWL